MKDTITDYIGFLILAVVVGLFCGVFAYKFKNFQLETQVRILEKTCRTVIQ